MNDDDQDELQSERLKQAMIEIMQVARKYDVMAAVTLSEKQYARYSLLVPTWSVLQPAAGSMSADNPSAPANVSFRLKVPRDQSLDGVEERVRGTLFALASLSDAMGDYQKSLEHVLKESIKALEEEGLSVTMERYRVPKKSGPSRLFQINTIPDDTKH